MNIWEFVIGGALILFTIVIICLVLKELENRIEFQDKSISELEKTVSKYYKLFSTEMNRIILEYSNLTDDITKLKNNKKDKTEEDIINEELLKYSKKCAKAVEDRLNKKGDDK